MPANKAGIMSKKGTTLIESVIAIVLVSIAVVALLEALSVGIFGTMDVDRKTSALNLAKSQVEYVKAQAYNASIGDGNLSQVYGLITENSSDIIDIVNYNINGQVVNVNESLQKITVNVSYLHGKQVQVTVYKANTVATSSNAPYKGMVVTDYITDLPILYSGSGGEYVGCAQLFSGYYHVFNTSGGAVSTTWNFSWKRWDDSSLSPSSMGAPIIAIYKGVPAWANRDDMGVVKPDGIIYRQQDSMTAIDILLFKYPIGALPGAGNTSDGGDSFCRCYCPSDCSNERMPIWWTNHDPGGRYGGLPCSGAASSIYGFYNNDYYYWWYDGNDGLSGTCIHEDCRLSGTTGDRTFTTTLSAGKYTVLFFNAENKIDIETISAWITYLK